jgi:hypothetical protein
MMRKHGRTDLAYNAQVVSDAELQVVVAAEVETVETDNHLLVPMLENVKATVGAVATTTLADAGYFSGEQLAEAEARGLDVKVAMPKVAARETDEFHRDRFTYDNTRDVYVCPTGELLAREREMKKRGVLLTVYRCKNTECPVRDACTKSKDGRMIQRSEHEASFARRRAEARSSPGRESMRQRGAIVEPVFAQIKTLDGFTRFTVRGIEKARAQWALVCAAYDLRKLYTFWRTGSLQLA